MTRCSQHVVTRAMIRANTKTALDLLLCFPECLYPRPRAVPLMRCLSDASNYERFRSCMARYLEKYGLDRTVVDRDTDATSEGTNNRDRYIEWLRLLSENLPQQFRQAHRMRLEQLNLLHRMAYGGVFDDIQIATELAKALAQEEVFEDHLTDCLRNDLIRHLDASVLDDATEYVPLDELTKARIDKLLDQTFADDDSDDKTHFLVLRSGCQMEDGQVMHIPMLDFRIDATTNNTTVVSASLRAAGAGPGVILNSGRSYHYYGFSLLSEQELLDFAHTCLLLIPFVDARYLGHCLLDREFRIRVSGRSRHGRVPEVVRFLGVEVDTSEPAVA